MESLAGTTLAKYDLIKQIGRGSMGIVYLAHDPFVGREVAVKVALPEALQDEETGDRYRKLFFNEARIAGALRHPNIVQVIDAGVQGDVCYLVLEYVEGSRTLAQYCAPDELLPLEDVVRMSFKCARALDYAHRKNVVHRDVKPRNVLVTTEQEVKLADFSTALFLEPEAEGTQVLGYVGSPMYMAPEQLMEETATAQSDVFALGIVLYQMLTGVHPFASDSLQVLVQRITQGPHQQVSSLNDDVPPVLSHIVDRALEKNPDQRYKSALDLAADLSLVLDDAELFREEVSVQERFKVVKDLRFFSGFSQPEIYELVSASAWRAFQAGESIIEEGEADTSFYVIVAGVVEVRKRGLLVDEMGPRQLLWRNGPTSRASNVPQAWWPARMSLPSAYSPRL